MGYVDTFRKVHGDQPDQYSWWSYKTRAREKNIGWRIDYFFVSEELAPAVSDAWIENNVYGSGPLPGGAGVGAVEAGGHFNFETRRVSKVLCARSCWHCVLLPAGFVIAAVFIRRAAKPPNG